MTTESLLEQAMNIRPTRDYALRALECMDLTSLGENDTETDIQNLCARAETEAGKVAAVCVYDRFVPCARRCLRDSGVRVATVCNFPKGGLDADRAAQEAAEQVAAGAHEIDVVLPYRAYLSSGRSEALSLVRAVRKACGAARTLKVILETGELKDPDIIRNASLDAIDCGADFIKTSTGKVETGATPEAVKIMLDVIKSVQRATDRPLGVKPSGGISTVQQAATYLFLADEIMGPGWAKPETFRFGASSLQKNVLDFLGDHK